MDDWFCNEKIYTSRCSWGPSYEASPFRSEASNEESKSPRVHNFINFFAIFINAITMLNILILKVTNSIELFRKPSLTD